SRAVLRLNLIGPEPFLGEEAITHRIAKGIDMAGCPPDLWMHDDGRIQACHIVTHPNHGTPPKVLDVAFQFGPKRTVIPKTVDAPVDFRRLKNKAASLAQRHNFLHQLIDFRLRHKSENLRNWRGEVKRGRGA